MNGCSLMEAAPCGAVSGRLNEDDLCGEVRGEVRYGKSNRIS